MGTGSGSTIQGLLYSLIRKDYSEADRGNAMMDFATAQNGGKNPMQGAPVPLQPSNTPAPQQPAANVGAGTMLTGQSGAAEAGPTNKRTLIGS
ncbi:hypothetical protein [Caudoviricetes sp.]|jgi:hypothetical protein|nr:hypothetical protein [Caudoviricetes sp.]